ncbi:MAG: hypothetical protein CM1200mP30_20820 [Pseudomonadota bacterium]|nr:MAG: hypothetical protein CM1200mP30_20820 [Pseudomonadota bacterium]
MTSVIVKQGLDFLDSPAVVLEILVVICLLFLEFSLASLHKGGFGERV